MLVVRAALLVLKFLLEVHFCLYGFGLSQGVVKESCVNHSKKVFCAFFGTLWKAQAKQKKRRLRPTAVTTSWEII